MRSEIDCLKKSKIRVHCHTQMSKQRILLFVTRPEVCGTDRRGPLNERSCRPGEARPARVGSGRPQPSEDSSGLSVDSRARPGRGFRTSRGLLATLVAGTSEGSAEQQRENVSGPGVATGAAEASSCNTKSFQTPGYSQIKMLVRVLQEQTQKKFYPKTK